MSGECNQCGEHALECICKTQPEYSIAVYKSHARIKGSMNAETLNILFSLGIRHGFTYIAPGDGEGFKLIRKPK